MRLGKVFLAKINRPEEYSSNFGEESIHFEHISAIHEKQLHLEEDHVVVVYRREVLPGGLFDEPSDPQRTLVLGKPLQVLQ